MGPMWSGSRGPSKTMDWEGTHSGVVFGSSGLRSALVPHRAQSSRRPRALILRGARVHASAARTRRTHRNGCTRACARMQRTRLSPLSRRPFVPLSASHPTVPMASAPPWTRLNLRRRRRCARALARACVFDVRACVCVHIILCVCMGAQTYVPSPIQQATSLADVGVSSNVERWLANRYACAFVRIGACMHIRLTKLLSIVFFVHACAFTVCAL